jgi:hypothetical protein
MQLRLDGWPFTNGASYDLIAVDQEDDGTLDPVILVAVVGSSHLAMADLLL